MYIIFGSLAALFVVVAGSGLFFRRHSLPCPVWLRWCVELDNPFAKSNHAAFIVARLDIQPGMAILDAGCGPGRITLPLARQTGSHGEVLAMDLQQGMLQSVEKKAQAAGLKNIRFLQAGIGEGALPPAHFDRAVLSTVLGEIPDRQRALNELFDALKPGALLSVTEIVFDPHFQSRTKVLQMAQAAGFRENAFWGNRFAYTLHLQKPAGHDPYSA